MLYIIYNKKFHTQKGSVIMRKPIWMRLVCVALLCLTAVLCACSETANDESSANASSGTASERKLFDNLPEKDFGGKDCVFLVEGDYRSTYASVEICPQENNYQGLNDAIGIRNALIKEKFNVNIKEMRTEGPSDMLTLVRSNAVAGVSEYDVIMPYMSAAASLAMEGYFYDLATLENIHLREPYYDQGAIKGLSVAEKSYFATGDASLLSFACTHAIVFNKDLIKDHGLENPYDLVKNGTWTIDKLQEMARTVTADTDGTPGMGYRDTYGFLVNGNFVSSLFIGAGQRFSDKDEHDEPIVAVNGSGSSAVFDKIFNLVNDQKASSPFSSLQSGFYTSATADGKDIWIAATEAVANKTALFRAMALIDIFDLGEYECSFGILPVPKFSESQDNYYSRVSTLFASCVAIPVNAADPEMSAIVTDALMQASSETVKDAYFQVIMKDRKIQDPESEEMLDIIFDSRVYDLAFVYNWGGTSDYDPNALSAFMDSIVFSGQSTFASSWQSIADSVQAAIDETVKTYRSLT